jgi:formylglycine-generating enzyme required for sulfatase activity
MTRSFAIGFLVLGLSAGCSCRSAALAKTQDASNTIQDALNIVQVPLQAPTEFAPGCVHPAVTETCVDGWCRIPEGCFLQGSPEEEPDRAMYGEQQTAVTLTHPFLIQQHEVTQAEWVRFGGGKTGLTLDPASGLDLDNCLEDSCPACLVNLVEAMAYANFLSVNSNPPLTPCFKLVDCNGPTSTVLTYPLGTSLDGERMACADFSVDAASIYDCEGFRLPTESEWEYAARAGSRTAFYLGDHTKNPDPLERTHYNDPNLSPVAWYNWNSGNRTHPVMQKLPNAWGLYDVLGNTAELTYSIYVMADFTGPMVDPVRPPSPSDSIVAKGAAANGVPGMLRAADRAPSEPNGLGRGLRLVRALKQGEVWPPGGTK